MKAFLVACVCAIALVGCSGQHPPSDLQRTMETIRPMIFETTRIPST